MGSDRQRVTVDGESLGVDEVWTRARALSPRLAGAEAVAVIAHPSMSTVVAVLAGLEAGVPVVPVSPDAGPREREHVLADAGCAVVVDRGELSDGAGGRPAPDAALILYTSGTTGPPKGVPLTSTAIHACLDGLADAWAWSPDDVLVHGLPLHHVHGLVLGILGPLRIGSSVHHTGRPTPAAYASAHGSLYFGVPTIWTRIAADASAARALSGARLLVSGSAALPAPTFDGLQAQCGHAPLERYGMTETLITLAARVDEPAVRGSVGQPLPGVGVRIVDDGGREAPEGSIGALEVTGPTVSEGYLNRPDATEAARTPDGWFRTGDVAAEDADGRYRVLGRASTDLIKSGGFRVGAGEVEDALLVHPAVHEAAVVGQPDDDLGQRIVAFVVADDGTTTASLVSFVAETLSAHKRPRQVHFVAALPRNAMGKVDKSRLEA